MSKSYITITGHQEDKQSKATSSLFPIKMIATLERTQSNVQQNMEETQNPTVTATINNESTATETLLKMDSSRSYRALKCILKVPIFALEYIVVKAQNS